MEERQIRHRSTHSWQQMSNLYNNAAPYILLHILIQYSNILPIFYHLFPYLFGARESSISMADLIGPTTPAQPKKSYCKGPA
jgi:hypothetical protein